MYSDPRVVRFLSGIPVPDRQTQRERLRKGNAFFASLGNGTGSWAMIEKATNGVIGTVLLKQLPLSAPDFVTCDEPNRPYIPPTDPNDLAREHEIGWHLAPQRWGNGFATEAARALLAYGFEQLGQPVIYAVIKSENIASMGVAKRLGMTHLGPTRRYYNAQVELFEIRRAVIR